jgi:hypothetical protein
MKIDYVELTEPDLEHLITVCQWMVDYKYKVLNSVNWQNFQTRYLPGLVDALRLNKFKVVDPNKNILLWIIDNIEHSRRIVPGQARDEWQLLGDMDQIRPLLERLRAASRGSKDYKELLAREKIKDLFRIE